MAKKIEIEIVGDSKGFQKSLNQAAGSADGFGSKIMGLGKLATAGLAAVGIGAAAAGAKMIGMAYDAAEVDSKLQVTFGKTLPQVTSQLDKFSEATGTSRFEMRQQAADMGALLAPMLGSKQGAADMSVQFVKLATDLGSFNNIPTAEALEKIRAGLVGEAEPLRSLGVLLTEASTKEWAYTHGIAARGKELTEVQKVEARAGQIMAQTALAQGDATRTADSFANQMKRLKSGVSDAATEIGLSLLPMASKIVGALNDGAKAVGSFVTEFSKAKGLEAKVKVVIEAGKDLAQKAITIGQDVGKEIAGALEKVNWSTTGTKVAEAIGTALRAAVPAALDLASSITIGFLRAMDQIDWVVVGKAIGSGMKDGMIKGGGDIIKKGGRDLMAIVQNPMQGVAQKVGDAVGKDIGEHFGKSGKTEVIKQGEVVGLAIKQGMDPAIATAVVSGTRIGEGLGTGMAQGIINTEAIIAMYAVRAVNHAYSAASNAAQMHSPSRLFAKIGEGLIDGVGVGMDGGLARLTPQAQKRFQDFMDAIKAKVEAGKTALSNALSGLGDKLNSMFAANTQKFVDALSAGWDKQISKVRAWQQELTAAEQALRGLTEAEATLAALDKGEAERSRSMAVAAAQEALLKAQSVEDTEERARAIIAAEEQLRSAQLAITRAKLQEQAAAEREALASKAAEERDARNAQAAEQIAYLEAEKAREVKNLEDLRAVQQIQMNARLAELVANLTAHPKEWNKTQQAILKLLASYGVDYRASGKVLGAAFAYGLTQAEAAVEKAAKGLAKIPQSYLQLKSPAEKGPLSTVGTWFKPLGSMLASQMNGAALAGGAAGMAGAAAMGGGAAGGRTIYVTVNMPNYLGDVRDAARQIKTELQNLDRVATGGRTMNSRTVLS